MLAARMPLLLLRLLGRRVLGRLALVRKSSHTINTEQFTDLIQLWPPSVQFPVRREAFWRQAHWCPSIWSTLRCETYRSSSVRYSSRRTL